MKPILQIALDIPDIYKALEIGVKISSNLGCKNIWLEAGTPLIKSWGKVGVRLLKDLTKCFVVADSKTMDTGALEAEIFYNAGADVFTVLGLADNSTIREALNKAREYDKLLMVDLINHPKPYERAIELDKLGVDIILYHVGIDVQMKRGISITHLIDELKRLRSEINSKLAVAGGIKHGEARRFIDIGVDIVVVGGAIIKSEDPVTSTRSFLEELLG
ncbi:MAG: orotidine 5-phosphate decarboxylase [Desulfurococcales archaeon ex4484_58]|nr:MAG: orotidine 5-phosphate decarboxylase [Desulfurococcales archaeon ex4484_58]